MQKILIVEDNPGVSEIMARALQRAGYHIFCAADGIEALRLVEKEMPDLILLDLGIPKLPGEEVCRAVRRSEKTRDIPIIMVTGKTRDVDKVFGKVIGANQYITKPFDIEYLVKSVKDLFETTDLMDEERAYLSPQKSPA
jgi:DNA-binding response OmpR family regulator